MTAAEQDLRQCYKVRFGTICHGEDGKNRRSCIHVPKYGSICHGEDGNNRQTCIHTRKGSACHSAPGDTEESLIIKGLVTPRTPTASQNLVYEEEEDMSKIAYGPEYACKVTSDLQ